MQHGEFVDREIDHAIRHDRIEACGRKAKLAEFLDIAFEEFTLRRE